MLSQDLIPLHQLKELVKLRYLKKLLSNKHLQEVALVLNASSISYEEIESTGKKSNVYYFQGRHRPFPQIRTPKPPYLESNYSKILRQTRNTICSRIRFTLP